MGCLNFNLHKNGVSRSYLFISKIYYGVQNQNKVSKRCVDRTLDKTLKFLSTLLKQHNNYCSL